MTLLRVVAAADWKGRPSVSVRVLGKSADRAELVRLQDADVAAVRAEDLAGDQEAENEEAQEEGRTPARITEWESPNRWEMTPPVKAGEEQPLRELVYRDNGEFSSVTYHILPE